MKLYNVYTTAATQDHYNERVGTCTESELWPIMWKLARQFTERTCALFGHDASTYTTTNTVREIRVSRNGENVLTVSYVDFELLTLETAEYNY